MIEISSSVEKKDPAAAGSFFFWKNVYFVSTKTGNSSKRGQAFRTNGALSPILSVRSTALYR